MKLHLPLSLRSALLAACSLFALQSYSYASVTSVPHVSVTVSGESNYVVENETADDDEGILATGASAVFTGCDNLTFRNNRGYLAYNSDWSVSNCGEVTFSNNTKDLFHMYLNDEWETWKKKKISFDTINKLTFSGNLNPIFSSSPVLEDDDYWMYDDKVVPVADVVFSQVKELNFKDNKSTVFSYSPQRILNQRWNLTIANCKTVNIVNNEVQPSDAEWYQVTDAVMDVQGDVSFDFNDRVFINGNRVIVDEYNSYYSENEVYMTALFVSDGSLSFNTRAGQVVECYDGLEVTGDYEDKSVALLLNAKSAENNAGTIIFSGEKYEENYEKYGRGYKAYFDVITPTLYVHAGTMELRDGANLVCYESMSSTHDALVKMKDASINFSSHSGDDEWFNSNYGSLEIPVASFEGCNIIRGTEVMANEGTWSFLVTEVNQDKAVLTLDAELYTSDQQFEVKYDEGLAAGTYKLLVLTSLGEWSDRHFWKDLETITFKGTDATHIGDSDVYVVTSSDGTYTLYWELLGEGHEHRSATTLTWTAESGTWSENYGADADTWDAPVSDKNFYKGDQVVFNTAASVTIDGVVRPADILVTHETGALVFSAAKAGGQISGLTTLTKKNGGELVLNMANAYTGDTMIEGGKVTLGHKSALGLSTVYLKGGELDMGGYAVGNELRVQGTATLSNSAAFDGLFALESGELSGDELKLNHGAELKSGSITNKITARGESVVKTGFGTVSISGVADIAHLEVNSGTLTFDKTPVKLDDVTIQSFATLNLNLDDTLNFSTITLDRGATLRSNVQLIVNGNRSLVSLDDANVSGSLLLAGKDASMEISGLLSVTKEVTLSGGTLTLYGTLKTDSTLSTTAGTKTTIYIDFNDFKEKKKHTLFRTSSANALADFDLDALELPQLVNVRKGILIEEQWAGRDVVLELQSQKLVWQGEKTGTWGLWQAGEWDTEAEDQRYFDLDEVVFDNAGEVKIVSKVMPGSILVQGSSYTKFFGEEGSIVGDAVLTKTGSGVLELANDNSEYEGAIVVNEGTLKVGHEHAMGKGAVSVTNASFDGGDYGIDNLVTFRGASTIDGAANLRTTVFDAASMSGSYALSEGKTLVITPNGSSQFTGDFTFAGGTLYFQADSHDRYSLEEEFAAPHFSIAHRDGASLFGNGRALSGLTVLDLSDIEEVLLSYGEEMPGNFFSLIYMPGESDDIIERFVVNGSPRWTLEYEDDCLKAIYGIYLRSNVVAQMNENQRSFYNALLENAYNNNGCRTGALAELVDMLIQQKDAKSALAMLDRLSGAELATTMTSQVTGNMAHLHRLRNTMGTGDWISKDHNYAAYVSGYADMNKVDANADGQGIRRNETGGIVGFEWGVYEKSLMGMALTSGSAKVTPTGGQRYNEDDTRIDMYVVGNYEIGLQSVTSFGVGLHTFDVTRNLPGNYVAHSDIDGYSINLMQEISYTIALSERSSVQPFVSLEVSINFLDYFEESGAGSASLEGDARTTVMTDLTLGARYEHKFQLGANTGSVSGQMGVVMNMGSPSTELDLWLEQRTPYKVKAAGYDGVGFKMGVSTVLPITKSLFVIGTANLLMRSGSEETDASVGLRVQF